MRVSHVPLGVTAPCLYPMTPHSSRFLAKFAFPDDRFLFYTENWSIFILHRAIYYLLNSKQQEKNYRSPY